jgi:hypothetical protein
MHRVQYLKQDIPGIVEATFSEYISIAEWRAALRHTDTTAAGAGCRRMLLDISAAVFESGPLLSYEDCIGLLTCASFGKVACVTPSGEFLTPSGQIRIAAMHCAIGRCFEDREQASSWLAE